MEGLAAAPGQKYETVKMNGKTEKFRFVMLFGFTLNKMIEKESVSSQIVGGPCPPKTGKRTLPQTGNKRLNEAVAEIQNESGFPKAAVEAERTI